MWFEQKILTEFLHIQYEKYHSHEEQLYWFAL